MPSPEGDEGVHKGARRSQWGTERRDNRRHAIGYRAPEQSSGLASAM